MRLKRSRKLMSILLTLSLLVTLLVPMVGPASALSDNSVNKVVTLNDEFIGNTGVVLTIKEDSDFVDHFDAGDVFQLVLPAGLNWNNPTVVGATYSIIGDQTLELAITADTASQDTITVTMNIEVDGLDGDATVEVKGMDSGVTNGKYVFARISGDTTTASAMSVETIGDPGVGGSIRIEESSLNALFDAEPNAQKIELKLPSDFAWDLTDATADAEVTFSGGFTGLAVNNGVGSAVANGFYDVDIDEDTMTIWFNLTAAATQRGLITVDTPINPDKDANYGDVEVSISGDQADDADVVVAKYADYGVEMTVDSVKDILVGKYNQELDTIVIEESVPGTLVEGRDITLVFPSWVMITDADVSVSGGGLAAAVTAPDGFDNELDINITNASANNTGKIELDLEISVEGNKSGDIEVEVDGSKAGIPAGTKLVVGKAVSLAEAKADGSKDVKIGVQSQEIGDITISELIKDAFNEDPNGNIAGTVVLTLPEGVFFASKPKVEVTEGNIDIDEANIDLQDTAGTVDGKLAIPIKGDSSKASTLKLSGVKVTVDRTVPTGDLFVKVGGGAIIENQRSSLGWLNGAAVAGAAADIDEGEFDTGTAVKVKIGNIITPAPGEVTGTAVFKIGETKFTLNGVEKTMDVAPYLKNDRTYMPLRFVANVSGVNDANIMWNAEEQSVVLVKGDRVVKLVIGSTTMLMNGIPFEMDVAPELVDPGRTMLPVRWVAQVLGCTVAWDEATQSVTVSQ